MSREMRLNADRGRVAVHANGRIRKLHMKLLALSSSTMSHQFCYMQFAFHSHFVFDVSRFFDLEGLNFASGAVR